jgi:uncharacterized CHY-type Zn-finger protein
MEKTKICTFCKKELTLSNYTYRKTRKGRACLRSMCKDCEFATRHI